MPIVDSKTPYKAYVGVRLLVDPEGRIIPTHILWDDAHTFEIDRVTDVRQAASLKAGGMGTRYTCRISGQERYLFYDDRGKWFLETSKPMA